MWDIDFRPLLYIGLVIGLAGGCCFMGGIWAIVRWLL